MKNIVILGSTGSIGRNALDVIRNKQEEFNVLGLSGHNNYELIIEQIKEFKPKYVSIGTLEGKSKIEKLFPDLIVYFGRDGLKKLGQLKDMDIILVSVTGAIGIEATVEAIKLEKRIALANKETLVAGGDYINSLLDCYPKAEMIPVDSEHSAIFQSLLAGKKRDVKNLIITASGGTFRGKTLDELKNVTVEEALCHPNWSMGKKITVDSSTLINKGLEVIEAHHLFKIDYDKIKVIVHPQSIIHSMVEYNDNSVIAQLGAPDMKLPIQLAFSYPDRIESSALKPMDLLQLSPLTFEQADTKVFKGLELAYTAGKIGGSMPTVLNAANEVAVELFLKGKIRFLEIYSIIENAMKNHEPIVLDNLDSILAVDESTRTWVYENYKIQVN